MSANVGLNKTTINDGFLSGFIESSVEMLGDGLNGGFIIHYRGDHS